MSASTLRIARLAALTLAAMLLSMLFPNDAKANVVCLIDSAELDFGTSDTGTGAINWTCTNYLTQPQNFNLCAQLGTPSWPGTNQQPKLRNNNTFLDFNVYRDAATSQVWRQNQPLTRTVSIAGGIGKKVSGSFAFYGRVASGQSPPPGFYQAFFYNTVLGFPNNGGNNCQTSAAPSFSAQQFTLTINKTVSNDCQVTAQGNANLGQAATTVSPVYGSTSISVRCSSGTPYNIGLQPSNGNANGAGELRGSVGNGDRPAYQLRRTSGSGPIWGNTASVSGAGNGVGGTGNGTDQSYPVYVSVPNTNYKPDAYRDTVTVTLNF